MEFIDFVFLCLFLVICIPASIVLQMAAIGGGFKPVFKAIREYYQEAIRKYCED